MNRITLLMFVILLVASIVLLQSGTTYYLSFQIFGLLLVTLIIAASGPIFVNVGAVILVMTVFSAFLVIKSIFIPQVVSINSENIIMTTIGAVSHALILIIFTNLKFKRTKILINIFKLTTATVIIILVSLIILTKLSLFSFIDSHYFLLQNSSLVFNMSPIEMLQNDLRYRIFNGIQPRVDLFYGESSFLAIVLMSCAVSHCIISRISSTRIVVSKIDYRSSIVMVLAILGLLSLESLSSIIYAVILATLGLRSEILNKLISSRTAMIVIWLFIIMVIGFYSYDTLYHRISTIQNSLSLSQRFGPILVFGVEDFMFGLLDESIIPKAGIHNGLIYLIAISGLGGFFYFIFILNTSIYLSQIIKMRILVSLTLMALAVQNGAMFSPNKMVLFSLILLPLSCIRTINFKDNQS